MPEQKSDLVWMVLSENYEIKEFDNVKARHLALDTMPQIAGTAAAFISLIDKISDFVRTEGESHTPESLASAIKRVSIEDGKVVIK